MICFDTSFKEWGILYDNNTVSIYVTVPVRYESTGCEDILAHSSRNTAVGRHICLSSYEIVMKKYHNNFYR